GRREAVEILVWRVFFTRTGSHPRIKSEGMLRSKTLSDRDAAADGAVEDLRGLFDAVGRGVQRVGHRGLRRAGAVGGDHADVAQRVEFFLERAGALMGVDQF